MKPNNRSKGPLICLHPKAKEPVMFKMVGDVLDVPDEVAYDLLKKHSDMLMEAKAMTAKVEKDPPKPKAKKKAPAKNKMMTTEMLKDK